MKEETEVLEPGEPALESEIIQDNPVCMRMLFCIDTADYNMNGTVFSRPSARGIIIRDGKAAMIHSLKYNY